MGQWQAEIPVEEHPAIVRRVRNGETLAQVGTSYRTSRQRIHQIIQRIDPDAARIGRAVRRMRRREQAEVARQARLAARGPCRICGGSLTALRYQITCSSRCAELWVIAALHLSDERHEAHRQSMARAILAGKTSEQFHDRAWASDVVAGQRPPNRRYVVPGSRVAKALAEVDSLRETAGASP